MQGLTRNDRTIHSLTEVLDTGSFTRLLNQNPPTLCPLSLRLVSHAVKRIAVQQILQMSFPNHSAIVSVYIYREGSQLSNTDT